MPLDQDYRHAVLLVQDVEIAAITSTKILTCLLAMQIYHLLLTESREETEPNNKSEFALYSHQYLYLICKVVIINDVKTAMIVVAYIQVISSYNSGCKLGALVIVEFIQIVLPKLSECIQDFGAHSWGE